MSIAQDGEYRLNNFVEYHLARKASDRFLGRLHRAVLMVKFLPRNRTLVPVEDLALGIVQSLAVGLESDGNGRLLPRNAPQN